jgi:hypothetical protein
LPKEAAGGTGIADQYVAFAPEDTVSTCPVVPIVCGYVAPLMMPIERLFVMAADDAVKKLVTSRDVADIVVNETGPTKADNVTNAL